MNGFAIRNYTNLFTRYILNTNERKISNMKLEPLYPDDFVISMSKTRM